MNDFILADFNLALGWPIHQTAKFNSPANFLAIWYDPLYSCICPMKYLESEVMWCNELINKQLSCLKEAMDIQFVCIPWYTYFIYLQPRESGATPPSSLTLVPVRMLQNHR